MKVCLQCKSLFDDDIDKCPFCGWSPSYQDGFPLFAPEIVNGGVSYPTDSHDHLSKIEEKNFWFVSRNKILCYFMDKYFPFASKMMELGCGTGFVLSGLARHRPEMYFLGAEAYIAGLRHARQRFPTAEFAQIDARSIPYFEEFDIIGAFDVIEHIDDDRIVLQQMFQALKPGGGIMITVPQHPWLWSNIDVEAGHKRRYTKKELLSKINAAGFTTVKITSFITLLLPFMAISRLTKRFTRNTHAEERSSLTGLQLSSIINKAFMAICDLERIIVKMNIPLPGGGSLACIAKKEINNDG